MVKELKECIRTMSLQRKNTDIEISIAEQNKNYAVEKYNAYCKTFIERINKMLEMAEEYIC